MTLAPPGTPLWNAQKDDFAPRLGLAWQPLPNLVFRAGAGIFYDLGYSAVADGDERIPIQSAEDDSQYLISSERCRCRAASFYDDAPGFLPRCGRSRITFCPERMSGTRRWKGPLGRADVLTVTYLGAAGRKLMRQDLYDAPNPNFTGEFDLMRNDADSSYNALASPVPPSLLARSPDAALLYLGAFDRRCFLRRLLPECAHGRFDFSERAFVRLRYPAHVLRRDFV